MGYLKKPCLGIIISLLACSLFLSASYLQPARAAVVPLDVTTYTVSFATSGGGSGSTTNPSGSQVYNASQVVSISATPGTGYIFLSWSASPSGAVTFAAPNSASTTATINDNATITATFQAQYTVSFATSGGGSGSTTNPSGSQVYNASQVVSISATPGTGYIFLSWSASPSGAVTFAAPNSASTTATINGNGVITASFAQKAYSISVTVVPTSGGNITLNPSGPYHIGDTVVLTESPNNGYSFGSWSGDGTGTGTTRIVSVTGDMSVTATFSPINYSISVTVLPSDAGTVIANATGPYHIGDVVVFTQSPKNGYSFGSWSGDGTGTGTTRQVIVSGNMSVTATFTQNSYSLSVTIVGAGGSVSKNPDQTSYHYGDTVVLTAVPVAGWSFSAWSGAVSTSSNPVSIIINGTTSVTASFTQISYKVAFSTSAFGTTTPSGVQTYVSGQIVPIVAIPNSGYNFVSWSASPSNSVFFGNTNAGSTSAIIDGNGTITATFVQPTPTASPSPTPVSTASPTIPTASPKPIQTITPAIATPIPFATPTASSPSTQNLTTKTILATASDGSSAYLTLRGNMIGSDVSSTTVTEDQTAVKTTVSLTLTGQSGTNSFCNITIPKEVIHFGTVPTVYINNQIANEQGYTQDANNYYVWFNAISSNYELSIVFTGKSEIQLWIAIPIVLISIVLVLIIVMPKIRSKR